jgi:hypothetical protein
VPEAVDLVLSEIAADDSVGEDDFVTSNDLMLWNGTHVLCCLGTLYTPRPQFSLGTWGHCPNAISILAGDFGEIIRIFRFFKVFHLVLSIIRRLCKIQQVILDKNYVSPGASKYY